MITLHFKWRHGLYSSLNLKMIWNGEDPDFDVIIFHGLCEQDFFLGWFEKTDKRNKTEQTEAPNSNSSRERKLIRVLCSCNFEDLTCIQSLPVSTCPSLRQQMEQKSEK
jgi:hypothetical protein